MKLTAPAPAESTTREQQMQEMAARTGQRLLKLGKTLVAFADDTKDRNGNPETFQVMIYRIDPRFPSGRSWTPGTAIAELNRKDSDSATIEALACLMITD